MEKSRHIKCSNDYDLPICIRNSSTEWPDLKFDIDGKNYFIPKDSYVECDDSYCYLYIMEDSSTDKWILGLNFFENYYTIYDYEKKRVGISLSATADPRMESLINKDLDG